MSKLHQNDTACGQPVSSYWFKYCLNIIRMMMNSIGSIAGKA
ncbi:hypothetical protein DAQ1742_02404 [Dickeya aquatica]|uniref:Uncharacterized protein n=1 Tax=Dickeya aquatica TaxID=1401087 RepID=A0A375AB05_9GAMM|nr:hypothetical protein DAQ1742_02404 [Dickeya aquatica]